MSVGAATVVRSLPSTDGNCMSTATVNIHELAEILDVCPSTILKGRKKGQHALYIRGFKIGDADNSPLRRFVDDVHEFLESKRTPTKSDQSDMYLA